MEKLHSGFGIWEIRKGDPLKRRIVNAVIREDQLPLYKQAAQNTGFELIVMVEKKSALPTKFENCANSNRRSWHSNNQTKRPTRSSSFLDRT